MPLGGVLVRLIWSRRISMGIREVLKRIRGDGRPGGQGRKKRQIQHWVCGEPKTEASNAR